MPEMFTGRLAGKLSGGSAPDRFSGILLVMFRERFAGMFGSRTAEESDGGAPGWSPRFLSGMFAGRLAEMFAGRLAGGNGTGGALGRFPGFLLGIFTGGLVEIFTGRPAGGSGGDAPGRFPGILSGRFTGRLGGMSG